MRDVLRGPAVALLAILLVAGCATGGETEPAATGGPPATPARPSIPATTVEPSEAPSSPTPARTPGAAPSEAAPSPDATALAWEQLPAESGPPAREDHTWTVDGAGDVAYLFGGRDADALGDLWTYDLAADRWSQLSPAGPAPPARFGHEAAWVDGIGLVVFAGQAGTTFYNDLWAYDPGADRWRQLPASGAVPVARYGTCSAVDADGRLWISHGFTSDGVRFADTRVHDFATGTWTDATPPGEAPVNRCLHACWLTDAGAFTLYAGQTTGVTALGDLWRLQSPGSADAAWRRVTAGDRPPDRNLPAVARWNNATIAFGGQGVDDGFLDDAWLLPDEREPLALASAAQVTAPPARAGAALVADAVRGRLLLFGGRNETGAFGDLWALSHRTGG